MREKNNKSAEVPDYLDYRRLKELGISYLQAVEGSIWTDFNIQDPGVTILELLCWSLMDLGYRTSFELNDLLTRKGTAGPSVAGTFYQAHEILSCSPVTSDDYRKLVLENIPQVKNIWFEPAVRTVPVRGVTGMEDKNIKVNGFYRVSMDLFDSADRDSIIRDVKSLFNTHRNLCENLLDTRIEVTDHVKVGICAEVEIDRETDLNRIFNTINRCLSEYVSPCVRYHSLAEMTASGKTPDRIYQGSNPRYGFIDMDELRSCTKRTVLYHSDVLNLIMSIDGVRSVSHLHFTVSPDSLKYVDTSADWKLSLKEQSEDDHSVSFVFQQWPEFVDGRKGGDGIRRFHFGENDSESCAELSGFVVRINGLPFYLGEEIPLYCIRNAGRKVLGREPVKDFSFQMPLPEGTYRFADRYFSLQNEFPELYRLGRGGISERASALRKAERLQLKAYLLFFEQMMADYLAQLCSLDKIFSWTDSGDEYDLTYFSNVLSEDEIKDLSAVLSGYRDYQKSVYPKSVTVERRNRFLNHLLARFNEEFIDYTIFNFWNSTQRQIADFDLSQAVRDKKAFLSGYTFYSSERFRSNDVTSGWGYSPVERRIMSKLGIDSLPVSLAPELLSTDGNISVFRDNSASSYNSAFGIHIIEHPLLSLCDLLDDTDTLKLTEGIGGKNFVHDPYSMQVTVVVPGWLDLCRRSFFRKTVERVLREELPAHISAKICWIDPLSMYRIEKACSEYKASAFKPDKEHLGQLVGVLNDIYSIYPSSVLGSGSVEDGTRIGYSVLGSDMNMRRGRNWSFEGERPFVPEPEPAPEPETVPEPEPAPFPAPEPEPVPESEPIPEPVRKPDKELIDEISFVMASLSDPLKQVLYSLEHKKNS